MGGGLPPPPPPPSRTKWTRRVPHPVLIGHAASLSQVGAYGAHGLEVVHFSRAGALTPPVSPPRVPARRAAPSRKARGRATQRCCSSQWLQGRVAGRARCFCEGARRRGGAACPLSTGGGTRLVRLVRGEGRDLLRGWALGVAGRAGADGGARRGRSAAGSRVGRRRRCQDDGRPQRPERPGRCVSSLSTTLQNQQWIR